MGYHLVVAPRKLLRELASHNNLTPTARAVYAKLYEDLPKTRDLASLFQRCIHILPAGDLGVVVSQGLERTIQAPIRYFEDPGLATAPALICESIIVDACFYRRVATYWLRKSRNEGIHLRFEPRLGGGQNTVTAYAEVQKRKKPLMLCITDGDRKSSDHDIGDTPKAVRNVDDPLMPLCEHLVLSVRAVENLVPTPVYERLAGGNPDRQSVVSDLKWLETAKPGRAYLHFKKGLKLADLIQEGPDSALARFWWPLLRKRTDLKETCCQDQPCVKKEKCLCPLLKGFGDKIMNAVIEDMDDIGQHVEKDDDLDKEWCRIGSVIAAWCCGSDGLRSFPANG